MFLVTCFVSFMLGSSWTAFAVVVPGALPLAAGAGVHMPLMLGALMAGGVFGDFASQRSGTSIISSMSAACGHVDHINTQMPYALLVAGVAFVGYIIAVLLV
jgi:Na+/H+ antiporter NhaC